MSTFPIKQKMMNWALLITAFLLFGPAGALPGGIQLCQLHRACRCGRNPDGRFALQAGLQSPLLRSGKRRADLAVQVPAGKSGRRRPERPR